MESITNSSEPEVIGGGLLAIIQGLPFEDNIIKEILKKHHLDDVEPESWYPVNKVQQVFAEIKEKFGPNTLMTIGKAVPEYAIFPPFIVDIESALQSIGMSYPMNHRNGDIGYYRVVQFNKEQKRASIECKSLYPTEFDKGIVLSMCRKFQAAGDFVQVFLDSDKPNRASGAETCTYTVTW